MPSSRDQRDQIETWGMQDVGKTTWHIINHLYIKSKNVLPVEMTNGENGRVHTAAKKKEKTKLDRLVVKKIIPHYFILFISQYPVSSANLKEHWYLKEFNMYRFNKA